MYYNTKLKMINILLAIILIPVAILAIFGKIDYKISTPIMLLGIGLQQLLGGYNYFKLQKKRRALLCLGISIISFLVLFNNLISVI